GAGRVGGSGEVARMGGRATRIIELLRGRRVGPRDLLGAPLRPDVQRVHLFLVELFDHRLAAFDLQEPARSYQQRLAADLYTCVAVEYFDRSCADIETVESMLVHRNCRFAREDG